MIIAGSDIGNDGAENIKRCTHADGLLDLHVGFDLIHRQMSGALHHDLHILGPCTLGQLTEAHKLFDLTYVAAVSKTSGTTTFPHAGKEERKDRAILSGACF